MRGPQAGPAPPRHRPGDARLRDQPAGAQATPATEVLAGFDLPQATGYNGSDIGHELLFIPTVRSRPGTSRPRPAVRPPTGRARRARQHATEAGQCRWPDYRVGRPVQHLAWCALQPAAQAAQTLPSSVATPFWRRKRPARWRLLACFRMNTRGGCECRRPATRSSMPWSGHRLRTSAVMWTASSGLALSRAAKAPPTEWHLQYPRKTRCRGGTRRFPAR